MTIAENNKKSIEWHSSRIGCYGYVIGEMVTQLIYVSVNVSYTFLRFHQDKKTVIITEGEELYTGKKKEEGRLSVERMQLTVPKILVCWKSQSGVCCSCRSLLRAAIRSNIRAA